MESILEFLTTASLGHILVVTGVGLLIASFFQNIPWMMIADVLRVPARVSGFVLITFGVSVEIAKAPISSDSNAPNLTSSSILSQPKLSQLKPQGPYVIHVSTVSSQSSASVTHDKIKERFGSLLLDTVPMIEALTFRLKAKCIA